MRRRRAWCGCLSRGRRGGGRFSFWWFSWGWFGLIVYCGSGMVWYGSSGMVVWYTGWRYVLGGQEEALL